MSKNKMSKEQIKKHNRKQLNLAVKIIGLEYKVEAIEHVIALRRRFIGRVMSKHGTYLAPDRSRPTFSVIIEYNLCVDDCNIAEPLWRKYMYDTPQNRLIGLRIEKYALSCSSMMKYISVVMSNVHILTAMLKKLKNENQ